MFLLSYLCFNHTGHDLLSLLFHFLDEWLYKFSADEFFIPRVSALDSAFPIFRTWPFPDNPSSECNGVSGGKGTQKIKGRVGQGLGQPGLVEGV